MWLIQIDKDQYINALNVDAVSKRSNASIGSLEALASGGTKISVAVSQNWFDVHPDYTEKFLNHLQACNGNHCANIFEGLTDKGMNDE